ncbi:MAG: hypothetical protein SFW35_13655, partial [Chitinophagales bacterium]|nr:hypothetical protein [Chitinophagales bacterium]
MNAVLAKEDFVLALTDAELLFYINYGLEPEERVSLRTFQRYKSYYNSWSELRAQEGTMVVEEVFAAFMKAMIELKV